MQKDWNAKGEEDPYYWSVTSNKNWETEDFYETGRRDVEKYVTPYLKNVSTEKMVALDIGCATGRMTRHLKFGEVVGVDVSTTMIAKARKDNPELEFHVIDGLTLNPLQSNRFNFVFSYSSLNHSPRKMYLKSMFNEIYRVLKNGGTARIMVRGFPPNSLGRTLWWKSFDSFYLAVGIVRGVPVPYFRFFNTQYGVCLKTNQLEAMTNYFTKSNSQLDANGGLWAVLEK